jgi:hypothetical protein
MVYSEVLMVWVKSGVHLLVWSEVLMVRVKSGVHLLVWSEVLMVWVKSEVYLLVWSEVLTCGFSTPAVIATRVHLTAKAMIVTVPAPSRVCSRLITLNGGVLHLALTGAARG